MYGGCGTVVCRCSTGVYEYACSYYPYGFYKVGHSGVGPAHRSLSDPCVLGFCVSALVRGAEVMCCADGTVEYVEIL